MSKFDTTNTVTIICNDWTLEELLPILEYLKYCGDIGHSVRFSIDEKPFFFDGDGASRMIDMIVNGQSRRMAQLEKQIRELELQLPREETTAHTECDNAAS